MPDYQYSVTGRPLHTAFYDVVQFNLRLRVDAAAASTVLQELQSESFITVLNVYEVTGLDPLVLLQEGYVFGDQTIIELDLQCEMLLLRTWTAPFIPAEIRSQLNEWSQSDAPDEEVFE